MGSPDDRYLLVDGNNLLSRAHHASTKAALTTKTGIETGALHYFVNMLSRQVRHTRPTHVSVYWDKGHAFRDRLYPAYKGNRERGPSGMGDSGAMDQAKEFLTWAAVPHRQRPGWEADDLIAFTARFTMGTKMILSGDRDLLQLLGEHTVQYFPDDDEPWTPERFEAKYGYPPQQAPYVKGLMGDPGDNVPGLPKIGPVKAQKMLSGAGWDWDALMATLTPQDRQIAAVTRELVDLRYLDYESKGFSIANCPSCMAFSPTKPGDMLWGPLHDFLDGLEMTKAIERLEAGTLWVDPDADVLVAQRDQFEAVFSDYTAP